MESLFYGLFVYLFEKKKKTFLQWFAMLGESLSLSLRLLANHRRFTQCSDLIQVNIANKCSPFLVNINCTYWKALAK